MGLQRPVNGKPEKNMLQGSRPDAVEFFLLSWCDLCAGEGCKICCITVVTWTLQVNVTSQPAFTSLKLTIETLEQGVKYVQC